jgi:hypothetical protein
MYSAPTELQELESQAQTRGTGTAVWDWTVKYHERSERYC